MAAAGEPHFAGDGGKSQVCCEEEKPGTINPSSDDVLVRGQSRGSSKPPGEVKGAEAGDTSDHFEREIVSKVLLYELQDARYCVRTGYTTWLRQYFGVERAVIQERRRDQCGELFR